MATKRPTDIGRTPTVPTTEEKFDTAEDDLYMSPDGTMTTYHPGDEDDEQSEWYQHPPTVTVAGVEMDLT